MKWQLKTARQLRNKLTENYLPVLNKPKPPKPPLPIDIIHPQNSLFTKYDANLTRSVNSVKTPLTQYQLFKNPRQLSAIRENRYDNIEQTEQANTISSIYPGKRYLYSEITLNNGYPFTDTIYCLPSPTEEIIPIIITPETPTSGPATSINLKETEESNKAVLKIPTTASLIFNKPEDTKKAKPKIRTTSSLILNKIDVSNKTMLKTSAAISLNLIRNTEINDSNKTIKNTPATTSLNLQKLDDFSIPTEKVPLTTSLILNKKDDFSKPVPQPRIKTNSVFKETDDLRNISETPFSTNLLNFKDMDDLTKTLSQSLLETPTSTINVIETAKSKTDDLSNITTETPSSTNLPDLKNIDDLTKTLSQPLLETPTTSINVNETVNLAKIIHNQLKSKSNDETPSSSEDESSGSLSQPSSDFEGSSTQASSLESV